MGGKRLLSLGLVEAFDVIPDKASRLRIETKGWFIEEENFGVVEKASSDFEPSFHATGKLFYLIFSSIP